MGDRLRRIARVAAWTAVLASALWAVDRLAFGPPHPRGWVRVVDMHQVPKALGIVVPAYLPVGWQWPPRIVLYRTDPTPGWWLGTGPAGQLAPRLWLGWGPAPHPQALGIAAGCLRVGPGASCPPGWHLLSTQLGDDGEVRVLTDAEALEAARIVQGLPTTREGRVR